MNAPALRPSLRQAAYLKQLSDRVKALETAVDEMRRINQDLRDQRDMARQTAIEQQDEFEQWRLRPTPRPARPSVRATTDIPTGEQL